MKKKAMSYLYALSLSSTLLLGACGGGDDAASTDGSTLNAHYFVGNTSSNNRELWKSDGTDEGTVLVKGINQDGSSYPHGKAVLNNTLFFVAYDGYETALWKSDGTDEGTESLTSGLQEIYNLLVSGNKLFFSAYDDDYGRELWVTDGTAAGTHMVIDLAPGNNGSNPYSLVDANGTLYFIAGEGLIWKTDGTPEGTLPAAGIVRPGSHLITAGNNVYFAYDDEDTQGNELWVTNGSFAGTHIVKDINPDGSALENYRYNAPNAVAVDNTLYFIADNGTEGRQIWKTDGSEAGTEAVTVQDESYLGLVDNYPSLVALDKQLYFLAINTSEMTELWSSDGTTAGTSQLTSLAESGTLVYFEAGFGRMDGYLYFAASNVDAGRELWKSDGTTEGTSMVKDIYPEGANSYPYGFSLFNNSLFFYANDGEHGHELWKTDGTTDGTMMLKDIRSGEGDGAAPLSNDFPK